MNSADEDPADPIGPTSRHRRVRPAIWMLAILATLGMVAACVPEPGAGEPGWPDAFNLNAQLVTDGFDISWNPTGIGQASGYQLQVIQTKPGSGTWVDIPSSTGPDWPSATFTDVTENTTYMFRVREAGDPEYSWSAPIRALYVKPALPVIRVNTDGFVPLVEKKTKLPMTASFEPNGSGFPAVTGRGTIRGRGNSTWIPDKKPYQIKFDSKTSLMGMSKSKKWVLLANYYDRSQMRTYTASEISQLTGLAWTPGFQWVELILNGEYVGLYQLAEKVDIGSNKINIDTPGPDDNEGEALTGGYFLQTEGRLEEKGDPGWRISSSLAIAVEDPDPATPQQFNYIKNHVNAFDQVLHSPNFKDPVEGYAKYLDVDSFIDYWLIQEATQNVDAFWDSTYFYKKQSDPKLYFGPIWDHDLTMGNPSTSVYTGTTGWTSIVAKRWPRALAKDPAIMQKANARWNALLPQLSQIPDQILAVGPTLEPAKANDRVRWGDQYGATRPEDTPQYLADWLEARIAWLTTAFAEHAG